MKTVTTTELRTNIYQLLDEVLATGIPLVISKNGKTLKIISDEAVSEPVDIFSKLPAKTGVVLCDDGALLEPTPYKWQEPDMLDSNEAL